jgi:hypothetical protein
MHIATLNGFARDRRVPRAFRSSATILLACCALALSGTLPVAAAQDANEPACSAKALAKMVWTLKMVNNPDSSLLASLGKRTCFSVDEVVSMEVFLPMFMKTAANSPAD